MLIIPQEKFRETSSVSAGKLGFDRTEISANERALAVFFSFFSFSSWTITKERGTVCGQDHVVSSWFNALGFAVQGGSKGRI